MNKKGEYAGPRATSDSTLWLRNFAGRYQSMRGALRGLALEAEQKIPLARQTEKKKITDAIAALDAAFKALSTPVCLEENRKDPLRDPAPRGTYSK